MQIEVRNLTFGRLDARNRVFNSSLFLYRIQKVEGECLLISAAPNPSILRAQGSRKSAAKLTDGLNPMTFQSSAPNEQSFYNILSKYPHIPS